MVFCLLYCVETSAAFGLSLHYFHFTKAFPASSHTRRDTRCTLPVSEQSSRGDEECSNTLLYSRLPIQRIEELVAISVPL